VAIALEAVFSYFLTSQAARLCLSALQNYKLGQKFLTGCWPAGWQKRIVSGFKFKLFLMPSFFKEKSMPIIAWLLGVPITVILLLMLFGVF
jgi:hypothetical protein